MKELLNLSLELLATLFILNVLVLFIPKGIRKGFGSILRICMQLFDLTFDIINKFATTAIKAVKSCETNKPKTRNIKNKPTTKPKATPSPIQEVTNGKVINLFDKVK